MLPEEYGKAVNIKDQTAANQAAHKPGATCAAANILDHDITFDVGRRVRTKPTRRWLRRMSFLYQENSPSIIYWLIRR